MATLNKDNLFLTRLDLKEFREISANISDEKINIFIREAQSSEARGFLGQDLWYLMQNDWLTDEFVDARFNDLWFGTDYTNAQGKTIRWNGYLNAVAYFTYSRFLAQQQHNPSRFGVESLQDDISTDISNAEIRSKGKDSYQMGFNYQNDCILFLTDKADTYPEWAQAEDLKPKRTSLSFFKV